MGGSVVFGSCVGHSFGVLDSCRLSVCEEFFMDLESFGNGVVSFYG